ncbi:hypothetical protein MJG53_017131 [Ovis ammon polii x Ovis aries]|uniref:Uncharacterized protein n=1 Tax=Ovis ammon polii x Ovis aries TaxID=2918886 RepID=A0ACB9U7D7_9CETA|nr:hypothetical protein MJG53_017131 [Ovis ammon polii x Ovis aries]
MPAFETRTDSPGETPEVPKIHVSTGEESSGSGPEFTQGLRPRHQRERNSERPPRNSHGDWPFLRPPERVPEGPVGRLQKYPKIHVSTGEESSGSGPEFTQGLRPRHQRERNSERPPRNSHGDWPFLRPPERVPEGPVGRLQKYPKIHVSTGEESSGSGPEFTQGLRPRHQRERNSERPPRNSHGDWPFLRPPERVPEGPVGRLQKYPKIHVSTGEESSGSGPEFTQGLRPRHQRERNSERPPRNSHGDWPFLRPPERVPEGPVPRIDSHHVCTWDSPVGKPRGKASWERHEPRIDSHHVCTWDSPVGKPRGKASWERHEPRIDSHHVCTWDSPVGKPRGKASWERHEPRIDSHHVCTWDSPVGKPRGKASWERHEPRIDSHHVCTWDSPVGKPRGKASWERHEKYPKIHVSTGEESSGSGSEFTQGLRPRHQRERNSERPPRNSHGDWPFLRPPERVPEGPVGKNSRRSRRISRGGALHRKGERNSRAVPPFQESPRCVSPFQRNLFSLHCLDVQAEDRLPPRVHVGQPCGKASWESLVGKTRGKEFRRSRRISRGGAIHRKGERNSRVVPPFQESPRCVSPFQRNRFSLHCLDVQAEDRLPPRVHVGQPCGKASWESLVGKTRGKTIDALINGADCVTLLLPLWRKAQVHARIRDED